MIVRDKHSGEKGYVVVSRALFHAGLSAQALGLMCFVLSLPDSWDFSIRGLLAVYPLKEAALRKALAELSEKGYCTIDKPRLKNGTFDRPVFTFYETPLGKTPLTAQTACGKDRTPSPPDTAKAPQYTNHTDLLPQEQENTISFLPRKRASQKKDAPFFQCPDISDVCAYREQMGYESDEQAFIAYHAKSGWKGIADWKAAFDYWEIGWKNKKPDSNLPDFDLKDIFEKPPIPASQTPRPPS